MEFNYFLPVNIVFGSGKVLETGELTRPYGKKALIVTGKSSAKKSGLYDKVNDSLKAAGLENHYTEHGKDIFPENESGVSFTTDYISSTGDVIANIVEDMAAEQKARAIYENLIRLTDNEEVLQPLLFLRQREIVHYQRFKELLEHYKKMGY